MGLWPHLPDMNASHFYLMDVFKGEVYNNEPYMEDDKKTLLQANHFQHIL
jgi:hypothetical protein